MNRFISLTVLLVLIGLLGSTFYQVIAPFLLPLFLAAILSVLCQPVHLYFLRKLGGRSAWAAALTTTAFAVAVVVPLVIGTFIGTIEFYKLADRQWDGDWRKGFDLLWQRVVVPSLERLRPFLASDFSEQTIAAWQVRFTAELQTLAMQLGEKTFKLASSTVEIFVSLVVGGCIFVAALYYFLADGPAILATGEELIPLPVDYQRRLAQRFAGVVRAVVTATFLAAFAQGVAIALALWFCGLGDFWFFLILSSIASLIPLAGGWLVWGPCAVWLALTGHWPVALALGVWGLAVVAMLDNGVKMYVLKSNADLHPLLAFISVIGALHVMGLWGIFIGPIVASCLFALIQILNEELKAMTLERRNLSTSSLSTSPPASPAPSPASSSAMAVKSVNPQWSAAQSEADES